MSQLQEIFRKKNEKKSRKGDAEKSAQLVRRFNVKHIISNLMGLCHKKVEKEMCQHIHVSIKNSTSSSTQSDIRISMVPKVLSVTVCVRV